MPSRILLADDSLTIRKVVELTFSGSEFELKAVGNGDDAVALLAEFEPDIVLADAVMPGKTGYDVCEEVKKRPGGRYVPVVLLTGTFEPFDKPRSERVGADSVVTKPFDSQGLASLVRDLVRRAAEAKASAPPEPPPAPEPPPPPPPPPAPEPAEIGRVHGSDSLERGFVLHRAAGRPGARCRRLRLRLCRRPPLSDDVFSTVAMPVFSELPPPARADFDPPTGPIPPVPPPPPALTGERGYEMNLDALDDTPEPQRRDLDEDIAAFERSDKGKTRRPEVWEKLAAAERRRAFDVAGSALRPRGSRGRGEPHGSQEPHPRFRAHRVRSRFVRGSALGRGRRPHRAPRPRAGRRTRRPPHRLGRRAGAGRAPREGAPRGARKGGLRTRLSDILGGL